MYKLRTLAKNTNGHASQEAVALVAMVALAGSAGFAAIGASMDHSINSGTRGVRPASGAPNVSTQAGAEALEALARYTRVALEDSAHAADAANKERLANGAARTATDVEHVIDNVEALLPNRDAPIAATKAKLELALGRKRDMARSWGLFPQQSLIFEGGSRSGKSSMMRELAEGAGANFVQIDGRAFAAAGDDKRLAEMLKEISRSRKRTVVYFEDIDHLMAGTGGDAYQNPFFFTTLAGIDQISSNPKVDMVASAEHLGAVDQAVFNRFDRVSAIAPPSEADAAPVSRFGKAMAWLGDTHPTRYHTSDRFLNLDTSRWLVGSIGSALSWTGHRISNVWTSVKARGLHAAQAVGARIDTLLTNAPSVGRDVVRGAADNLGFDTTPTLIERTDQPLHIKRPKNP